MIYRHLSTLYYRKSKHNNNNNSDIQYHWHGVGRVWGDPPVSPHYNLNRRYDRMIFDINHRNITYYSYIHGGGTHYCSTVFAHGGGPLRRDGIPECEREPPKARGNPVRLKGSPNSSRDPLTRNNRGMHVGHVSQANKYRFMFSTEHYSHPTLL